METQIIYVSLVVNHAGNVSRTISEGTRIDAMFAVIVILTSY